MTAVNTLAQMLTDSQSLAKVDKPADRRTEVEVETLGDTVADLKAKKPLDTLGEARSKDDTLTKRLVQVEVDTVKSII